MDEDIKQLILNRFDRLDNKLESFANELNRNIQTTGILNERILNSCSDIEEIKNKVIPSAIKEAVSKSKLWVYGSIGAGIVSIIITILLKVL